MYTLMNLPGSIILIIVIMVMFLVLVLAGVGATVWALSRSGVLGGTAPERTAEAVPYPEDDALDIVRRRYARGEIDRDKFDELRKDLES